jgi:hypothetical protein
MKTVRSTEYLTEEMIGWLGDIGKPMKSPQVKVGSHPPSDIYKLTCMNVDPQKEGTDRYNEVKVCRRQAIGAHADRIDRRPSKRRKKNESDDEDIEQGDDDDDDDEASSIAEGPAVTSDDDMSEDGGSATEDSSKVPKLGRGARGRAKVRV